MSVPEYRNILERASLYVSQLKDQIIDVVEIRKPPDLDYAIHLTRVISKLSPMLGNMIEYTVVSELNKQEDWQGKGQWIRQDPGFPDTIFVGQVNPTPGIEVKTWFPLATEITARFKDSTTHFEHGQTNIAMVAWLPESIIFGKPKVIDVWIDSAKSVADARDNHYHRPPDYLVFEPEDTTARTRNLQQTNTNGYKFQGSPDQLHKAEELVASWGKDAKIFSSDHQYQTLLKTLLGRFPYRLDTNFAKMDRIEHTTLEHFKTKVLSTRIGQYTIRNWAEIINGVDTSVEFRSILQSLIL